MALSDLENQSIGILGAMPERTPESIRKTLRTLLVLFPDIRASSSDEQLEECARRIEAKLFVKMKDAASIQMQFQEWLPQRRMETKPFYYSRYRTWLSQKGFVNTVLGVLDKDTDKVVGLLEDPKRMGAWRRRGLVVGHVQSGKTANYSGVICKAADYGYRFIVVLTGMQEDLRAQTQERIEEGLIGISSEVQGGSDSRIGVGFLGMERRPSTLTSRAHDFKTSQATLSVPIQSLSEPLVLVMKKNTRILANLVEWLKTKSPEGSGKISGVPMLVIDDEADNASVNTSVDMNSPTSINGRIRELLDLFERNVYVGYTATPFANIFIDPDSVDSWDREDLFPRDFIVSLDAPTNYVGASRLFSDDGDLRDSLVAINDYGLSIPERHKISFKVTALPPSLESAICVFVLARAARCLRGHGSSHSSMLVNVSRFNEIQTQITGLINDILNRIRTSCLGHSMLSEGEAVKDPFMRKLREAWRERFEGHIEESWTEIQPLLIKAVGPVEVRKINSKSADSLDYRRYKENGLHVIAVGGLALSRGFTLEGLTVSYFLRNSVMYDTLLQMGRWFGYRDGYADLCNVYMAQDAIGWYAHISEAIDELRDEFKRMERAGRTPKEFGLRVRSHPDSLIVTARNKMRSGKKVRHRVALGGNLIETTSIRSDAIEANIKVAGDLVARLNAIQVPTGPEGQGYVWSSIPAEVVRAFVGSFRNHDDACMKTQREPVTAYIQAREADELPFWDVCLYSAARGEGDEDQLGGLKVLKQKRGAVWHVPESGPAYISISGSASRVASRGAEKAGLSDDEILRAKQDFKANPENEGKNISDRAYREVRSRPLLMVHLLQVDESPTGDKRQLDRAVAWGISFPTTRQEGTEVEYIVNTTWWSENFKDDFEESDEEESANA